MNFNELAKEKQTALTAWMNGATIQYRSIVSGDWYDINETSFEGPMFDRELRVKPKEPEISVYYSALFNDGQPSRFTYVSISEVNQFHSINKIHSYIMKTYHDGVFVKAEVISKLELNLKGLE